MQSLEPLRKAETEICRPGVMNRDVAGLPLTRHTEFRRYSPPADAWIAHRQAYAFHIVPPRRRKTRKVTVIGVATCKEIGAEHRATAKLRLDTQAKTEIGMSKVFGQGRLARGRQLARQPNGGRCSPSKTDRGR